MKFGLREVCNVVLKAKEDNAVILGKTRFKGEPVLWFDSLKTSGLEGTAETVYARGGRGNTKLIAWDGDKEVTFTMEDALLSPESIAVLIGANEVKTEISRKHIIEVVNVNSSTGGHTLTYTPVKNTQIFYCNPDDVSDSYGIVKVSTQTGKVEIVEAALKNKTKVLVDYYAIVGSEAGQYKAKAATQIEISPQAFGNGFYLEGETLFREASRDYAAEFIIPSCRVQSTFNFTMASTGDPSTFTFTMDAFPDTIVGSTKKVLAAIQISEEEYID